MVIFNSYVKLPEGIFQIKRVLPTVGNPSTPFFEPRSGFWAALSLGFYADPNLFHHVIVLFFFFPRVKPSFLPLKSELFSYGPKYQL